MIVNQTRTQNFSAASAVDISDGKGTAIMFMNASVTSDGNITFM